MTKPPACFSPALHAQLTSVFAPVEEPRVKRTRRHELLDILVISLLAMLCGAEGWEEIEAFGRDKQPLLAKFLTLPKGIPSHDTFQRVLSRIVPSQLVSVVGQFVDRLAENLGAKVIAIDGKTLRGSFDRAKGQSPFHLVHAWASEHQLLLGQVATDAHSNEITAIPALLDLIDVSGAVVTIDAMGCQKPIAEKIVDKAGDYVLSLKDNHPTMHQEVQEAFEVAVAANLADETTAPLERFEQIEKSHGRVVLRETYVIHDVSGLTQKDEWKGLRSILRVDRESTEGGKTTVGRRHYLSRIEKPTAEQAARITQLHWSVETQLHWQLDVSMREDDCRVRRDHGPENLSTLRKIGLMLLKRTKTKRGGISAKQKRAGWSDDFLLQVLSSGFSGN